MEKAEGKEIARRMMADGYQLKGWCTARGLNYYTFRRVLYQGLGSKQPAGKAGSGACAKIFAALREAGYLPERREDDRRHGCGRRSGNHSEVVG